MLQQNPWKIALSGGIVAAIVLIIVALPPTWSVQHSPDVGSVAALRGISCPTPSVCFAVGDANGEPLVEELSGGRWSISATPLTTAADTTLTSVSCTSPTACMVVGYHLGAGKTAAVPVAMSRIGGSWSVLALSSNLDAYELDAVSCAGDNVCAVTGGTVAQDTDGYGFPFLGVLQNGSLSRVQVPSRVEEFGGVECPAVGHCIADLLDSNGSDTGVGLLIQDGTQWTPNYVAATPEGLVSVGNIACVGPNCFMPVTNLIGPLVASRFGTHWQLTDLSSVLSPSAAEAGVLTGTNITVPAISCINTVQCVIAGSCVTSAGVVSPFVMSLTDAGWERPLQLLEHGKTASNCSPSVQPTAQDADGAEGNTGGSIVATACTKAGRCWAVGYETYSPTADFGTPLILTTQLPPDRWYWSLIFLLGCITCLIGGVGMVKKRLTHRQQLLWHRHRRLQDEETTSESPD